MRERMLLFFSFVPFFFPRVQQTETDSESAFARQAVAEQNVAQAGTGNRCSVQAGVCVCVAGRCVCVYENAAMNRFRIREFLPAHRSRRSEAR